MVASAEWNWLSEAGDLEAVERATFGAEAVSVGEPDADAIVCCRDGDGEWAGVWDVLAVDEVACAECEASGDGLLVGRVNVVACAHVESDGHGGVGDGERAALRVADGAPVFSG